MVLWRCMAIVGILVIPGPAHAQDMDWGPIMQTEAMNSAIDEAARDGTDARPVRQSRTEGTGTNPKTRENCAKVRGWIAEGNQDPRLPRLAATCRQLGYR